MAGRHDAGRDGLKRPPVERMGLGDAHGHAVHPHRAVRVHRDDGARQAAHRLQIRHFRAHTLGRVEQDGVADVRRAGRQHQVAPGVVGPARIDMDARRRREPQPGERRHQRRARRSCAWPPAAARAAGAEHRAHRPDSGPAAGRASASASAASTSAVRSGAPAATARCRQAAPRGARAPRAPAPLRAPAPRPGWRRRSLASPRRPGPPAPHGPRPARRGARSRCRAARRHACPGAAARSARTRPPPPPRRPPRAARRSRAPGARSPRSPRMSRGALARRHRDMGAGVAVLEPRRAVLVMEEIHVVTGPVAIARSAESRPARIAARNTSSASCTTRIAGTHVPGASPPRGPRRSRRLAFILPSPARRPRFHVFLRRYVRDIAGPSLFRCIGVCAASGAITAIAGPGRFRAAGAAGPAPGNGRATPSRRGPAGAGGCGA